MLTRDNVKFSRAPGMPSGTNILTGQITVAASKMLDDQVSVIPGMTERHLRKEIIDTIDQAIFLELRDAIHEATKIIMSIGLEDHAASRDLKIQMDKLMAMARLGSLPRERKNQSRRQGNF